MPVQLNATRRERISHSLVLIPNANQADLNTALITLTDLGPQLAVGRHPQIELVADPPQTGEGIAQFGLVKNRHLDVEPAIGEAAPNVGLHVTLTLWKVAGSPPKPL